MRQIDAILLMLENGETVTPLDSLKFAGCFRLAARIKDLKKLGHKIDTLRMSDGNGKSFAGYRLARMKTYVEPSGKMEMVIR